MTSDELWDKGTRLDGTAAEACLRGNCNSEISTSSPLSWRVQRLTDSQVREEVADVVFGQIVVQPLWHQRLLLWDDLFDVVAIVRTEPAGGAFSAKKRMASDSAFVRFK